MRLDDKSKLILLQNLMNRAVDIEIADAAVDNRSVDIDRIEDRLTELSKVVGQRIAKF